jgi:hypothetical protein
VILLICRMENLAWFHLQWWCEEDYGGYAHGKLFRCRPFFLACTSYTGVDSSNHTFLAWSLFWFDLIWSYSRALLSSERI